MNKVKEYRTTLNLTQKELAQLANVTTDYISQIERGRIPGMDTAIVLAELFNTTIDELFFNHKSNKSFDVEASSEIA